jgi:hypothetical protein
MSQSFFNWARRPGFWVRPRNKTSELKKAQQNTWHVQRNQERANQIYVRLFVCLIIEGGAQGICASRANCSPDLLSMGPSMGACFTRHCCHSTSAARKCSSPLTLRCPRGTAWCNKNTAYRFGSPPYSPDQSTCAFCLFPRIKYCLRGYHFETVDDIQRTVTDDALKKLTEDFQ